MSLPIKIECEIGLFQHYKDYVCWRAVSGDTVISNDYKAFHGINFMYDDNMQLAVQAMNHTMQSAQNNTQQQQQNSKHSIVELTIVIPGSRFLSYIRSISIRANRNLFYQTVTKKNGVVNNSNSPLNAISLIQIFDRVYFFSNKGRGKKNMH